MAEIALSRSTNNLIIVGQIVKPQGVRGEVKVKPLTDDPSRFCALKSVFVCGRPCKIENVRISSGDVYIKLAGVDDRNAAETLRNCYLEIDRAVCVPLDDGEFFVTDLIGATVVACAEHIEDRIGIIRSIQSFGAADVFTVECAQNKEMTFAFVKALDAKFDSESKVLYVDGNRFKEVAVYDDD